MMHSKKINAVAVICNSKDGKPFRDYVTNSEFSKREANVFLPFDTEYQILIKNNNCKRMLLDIEIDGMSIGNNLIIDANSTGTIERFVNVASKFKFVSLDNENVVDPTSDKNGEVKIRAVLEYENNIKIIPEVGDWVPMNEIVYRNDIRTGSPNLEKSFYTTCYCDCLSDSSSGATIEGGKSDQTFNSTYWNGDDTTTEYFFIFNLKEEKKSFSKVEMEEINLLNKLQNKYKSVDTKKIIKENNKMKAEIISIIDNSGSMSHLINDTIGGYNSFIKEQKNTFGENISASLVLFNDRYETIYSGLKINKVPLLTESVYKTMGSTALIDTVCDVIDKTGDRLSKMNENERPDKVIVCILTDGEENASKEYTTSQLKEKIQHQRDKYNWEFVFLGANQDSFSVAESYGIAKGMTSNFKADSRGISDAYSTISCCVSNYMKDSEK
jgi:hypothetical protein